MKKIQVNFQDIQLPAQFSWPAGSIFTSNQKCKKMNEQLAFYQNKLQFETDASEIFQALEQGENIVVLDVRQKEAFEKEHIPGAVSLPYKNMNPETTAHFDKSKTYVCYCNGVGCNASTKGALNMTKLGFKAKELIGGITSWLQEDYASEGNLATYGIKMQCAC